jgi:hypothetical protein
VQKTRTNEQAETNTSGCSALYYYLEWQILFIYLFIGKTKSLTLIKFHEWMHGFGQAPGAGSVSRLSAFSERRIAGFYESFLLRNYFKSAKCSNLTYHRDRAAMAGVMAL